MTRGARGFTLLEVMIAVAITAVIGAMAASVYQQIDRAATAARDQGERYAGARLALTRLSRELSMAFISEHYDHSRFRERPTLFRGKEDDVLFTTMAHQRLARDAKESDQSVVEYLLDADPDFPGERALFRREKVRIDEEPDRGGTRAVLCQHVVAFSAEYWDWQKQEWVREWNAKALERQGFLPTRVRLSLRLRMPDGKEQRFETQAPIAIVRPLNF